jgi:hypothetical protein
MSYTLLLFCLIRDIILSHFWPSLQTYDQRQSSLFYPPEEVLPWFLNGSVSMRALGQSSSNSTINSRELVARDSCSEAFGPNASNSICVPSRTLCCMEPWSRRLHPGVLTWIRCALWSEIPVMPAAYGQRVVLYGKVRLPLTYSIARANGYFYGSNVNDDCYIDQPSACGEVGSIPCTNLVGEGRACCPAGTRCAPQSSANGLVRCNIFFGDLLDSTESLSTTVSTSTSAPSPTVTEPSSAKKSQSLQTKTISTPSDTLRTSTSDVAATSTMPPLHSPSQSAQSTSLPPPKLAGVIVGVILGVCLVVITGWLLYRRRRRQRQTCLDEPVPQPYSEDYFAKTHEPLEQAPAEIDSSPARVFELDGGSRQF